MDIPWIPSPNFKAGQNKPKFLVLHYTAGGSTQSAIDTFLKPDATSAHYIVGKDGEVVQMVRDKDIAYHAGKSTWSSYEAHHSLNPFSIGIEIVNWGKLYKDDSGKIRNWVGNQHHGPYLYKNLDYWDYYPFIQMATVVKLIKHIEENNGKLIIVRHSDISPGRKFDVGPAFDFDRLLLELT